MSYTIGEGVTGKKAVISGVWKRELATVLQSRGTKEIQCNYAKGWKGDDIAFVASIPWLKGFSLTSYKVKDLEPLYSLKSLNFLSLAGAYSGKLDFSHFPRLKYCFLEWWPGAKSVLQCSTLERAYFNCCKIKHSEELAQLRNLERLVIASGPLDEVEHIGDLPRLDYLGLYLLRKLETLKGLAKLSRLQYLHIEGCRRIHNIAELAALPSLEVCNLSDNGVIESLRPLAKVSSLKQLYFTGTTVIENGDLSCIKDLPNLNRLAFANRKHYSHKREDFWQHTSPAAPIVRYPIDDFIEEEESRRLFVRM
jgi:hypothetical protein